MRTVRVARIKVETTNGVALTAAICRGAEPDLRACEKLAKAKAKKAKAGYVYFDVVVERYPLPHAYQATRDYEAGPREFRVV